jgi:hypothetical protein
VRLVPVGRLGLGEVLPPFGIAAAFGRFGEWQSGQRVGDRGGPRMINIGLIDIGSIKLAAVLRHDRCGPLPGAQALADQREIHGGRDRHRGLLAVRGQIAVLR